MTNGTGPLRERVRPSGSPGGAALLRGVLSLLLSFTAAVGTGCGGDVPPTRGGAGEEGPEAGTLAAAPDPYETLRRGERRPAGDEGLREPAPAPRKAAPGATSREATGATRSGRQLSESRATAIVRAAEAVAPAVVSVNVVRRERARGGLWGSFFLPPGATRQVTGLGSGFIVDSGGIVLTNEHVVRGAERIRVTLPDGRDFDAELVGADEVTDVAVLRIDAGGELPVAPLGSSEGLMIGEWAVAIGNPFAYLLSNSEPTVTAGVVSAVDRHIIPESDERGFYLGMVQTDAAINPGNSGGPLVNADGEVVGVNSSIFSRSGGSEGLGFAIPIDRARGVADELLRWGRVRRAWFGLEIEPTEADEWGRRRGLRVSRVIPGSPAERAGIDVDARLLRADGQPLATPLDWESFTLDLRPGDTVTVEMDGPGPRRVRMVAAPLPSERAERVTVLREIELVTLTGQIRAERGFRSEHGALIVDISSRLRERIALRPGDLIVQIDNTPVRTAEDVGRIFESVAGRGAVRLWFERNGGIGSRILRIDR